MQENNNKQIPSIGDTETINPEEPIAPVIIEYELEYSIIDDSGNKIESGNANGIVSDKELSLYPVGHMQISIPFSDVRNIEDKSWLINLKLSDSTLISITKLGRKYDSFLKEVNEAYKKVLKKNLLMEEKLVSSFNEVYLRQSGAAEGFNGEGSVALQDTGLVLAVKSGEMKRIPYPFITKINDMQWSFHIFVINGLEYSIERLGRETEHFREELTGVMTDIESSAFEFVKSLDSSISPLKLRPYAKKLLDGLAVSKSELNGIPSLWSALEDKISNAGMKDSWDYLSSISDTERIRIGTKRALRGTECEYIWFFAPVKTDTSNTIVLEATSEGSGGRATYLFDIPRDSDPEKIMDDLNYCMYMVNFRREPIYLTDEQLMEDTYEHYRQAVERVDGLKKLRNLFLKRILHRSFEQWKKDIDDSFNR